ncbi:hypothetical protein ACFVTM_03745 [Arthrobacter sp. NPDC058130]
MEADLEKVTVSADGRSTVVKEQDLSIHDELTGVAISDDAREVAGAG